MNDKNIKEYAEKMRHMSLSEASRAKIRKNLEEYADFHTISEGVRVGATNRSIERAPKHAHFGLRLLGLRLSNMTAVLLIALLIGGGTSYAAQGAVPGDTLYPIKVEFNENIQSAFAISNEAEAKLQARLVAERLQEAEELAVRGELDAEVSADIQSRVETHYKEASERSDTAQAEGDFEASATVHAELEGTFRTYANILSRIDGKVTNNGGASLVTELEGYADASERAQATATADVNTDASVDVEATVEQATGVVAKVGQQLARAKSKLSADAYARINAQFNEAVRAEAEARASFRAEKYRDAYTFAQKAIRVAKGVETLILSALRVQIDLDVTTDGVLDARSHTNTEADSTTDVEGRNFSDHTSVEGETNATLDTEIVDVDTRTNSNIRLGL